MEYGYFGKEYDEYVITRVDLSASRINYFCTNLPEFFNSQAMRQLSSSSSRQ